MSAYKRTDPGKLARDRAAIQKSQESMNHPDHPAFEGIRKVFGAIDQAIKNRVAKNAERYRMKYDTGGPYGSNPLRTGAEEQTKASPFDLPGATVVGRKKPRSET